MTTIREDRNYIIDGNLIVKIFDLNSQINKYLIDKKEYSNLLFEMGRFKEALLNAKIKEYKQTMV